MSGGVVNDIINFKKNPDEDFYALLNCDENSSIEQIQAEYKVLALQHHPDKNSGDKDAEIKFQKLKEAKEILCDPERRANYDKWLHSGISISYKNWVGMKEHVHQESDTPPGERKRFNASRIRYIWRAIKKRDGKSMHWATPKTKDRMLPETAGAGLSAGAPPSAHRRASEGGAALYYGGRKGEWGAGDTPNEVVNKFRNYEI